MLISQMVIDKKASYNPILWAHLTKVWAILNTHLF